MNHSEITNDVIEQYVLGELDKSQVKEFEAHLFGCTDCLEELQHTEMVMREVQAAAAQPAPAHPSIIETITDWFVYIRVKPVLVVAVVLLAIYFAPGILNKQYIDSDLGTVVPQMHSTFLIENDQPSQFTVAKDAKFQIQINLASIAEPSRGTIMILNSAGKAVRKIEDTVIDPNARYTITLDANQLEESTYTFQCISSENEILLNRFFSVQFK